MRSYERIISVLYAVVSDSELRVRRIESKSGLTTQNRVIADSFNDSDILCMLTDKGAKIIFNPDGCFHETYRKYY